MEDKSSDLTGGHFRQCIANFNMVEIVSYYQRSESSFSTAHFRVDNSVLRHTLMTHSVPAIKTEGPETRAISTTQIQEQSAASWRTRLLVATDYGCD